VIIGGRILFGHDRAYHLVLNPLDDPVLERPEFLLLRRKLGYRD